MEEKARSDENVPTSTEKDGEQTSHIRVIPVEGSGNNLEAGSGYVKGVVGESGDINETLKSLKSTKIEVGIIKGDNNQVKVGGSFEVAAVDVKRK